jgi:hypothetical protein
MSRKHVMLSGSLDYLDRLRIEIFIPEVAIIHYINAAKTSNKKYNS